MNEPESSEWIHDFQLYFAELNFSKMIFKFSEKTDSTQMKRANNKLFASVKQRLGTQYKLGKAQEHELFREYNDAII